MTIQVYAGGALILSVFTSKTNHGGGKFHQIPREDAAAATRCLTLPRRHFIEDLLPYICLSDCKPPQMFCSSFQHWHDHMEIVHGQEWIQDL